MGGQQSRSWLRVQTSTSDSTAYARLPSSPLPSQRRSGVCKSAMSGTMTNQKTTSNTFTEANNSNAMKDKNGKFKTQEYYEDPRRESTFQMVHNPKAKMEVIIDELPTRTKIVLQVTDWDTVKSVKEAIQYKAGIPSDQQTLIYTGHILVDDCTLSSYGIRKRPIVHMFLHPIPKIRISVVTPMNDIITLKVAVWNTIQDIKTLISGTVGLQPIRQKLMYGGKQLDDDDILADYNFKSALHVVYSPMQIFIKMWSGKTITVEVELVSTVNEVMTKIEKKEQTSINHQRLTYGGRQLDLERTMADYNIQKESTLHLVMAASSRIEQQVKIRTTMGDTMTIKALNTDTICCVKDRIYQKSGIHGKILEHFGKELNDNQMLGHYRIKTKHTLLLTNIESTSRRA